MEQYIEQRLFLYIFLSQLANIYTVETNAPRDVCLHFLILHILRIIPKEQ